MLARVLNVTDGTVSPTFKGVPQASLMGGFKSPLSCCAILRVVDEEENACFVVERHYRFVRKRQEEQEDKQRKTS